MTADPSHAAFKQWQIQDRRNRIPELQGWTDEQIIDLVQDSSDREWKIWQAAMAHKEMNAWQPIATAPQDGSKVLLLRGKTTCIGHWDIQRYHDKPRPYWSDDREAVFGVTWCRTNLPTHWMPLPAAPLPQGE